MEVKPGSSGWSVVSTSFGADGAMGINGPDLLLWPLTRVVVHAESIQLVRDEVQIMLLR